MNDALLRAALAVSTPRAGFTRYSPVRCPMRLACIAALALSVGACASIPGPLGAPQRPCLPRFAYADGWLGGDSVYSVPSPGGGDRHETIWLFGDTYVGAPGARSREGAALVHNSAARSRCDRDGAFAIEYGWRRDEAGRPEAIFESQRARHHLWPFDGFHVDGLLYVLLLEVRESTPRGPLGLPIRISRTLLARVENPEDPPGLWRVETRALTRDGGPLLSPGVFVERGFVHMLAAPSSADGAHPRFLIRLPIATVAAWPDDLRPDLETFTNRGAWEAGLQPQNARILMRDNATEGSVDRIGPSGPYFVVYGAPSQTANDGSRSAAPELDAGSIFVRTARALTGPWSDRERIHVMPEALGRGRDERAAIRICYAAKAHAEHSPADVLVLTYVCNLAPGPGGDVWATLEAMQTRMDVYLPRTALHPWPPRSDFEQSQ